MTKINTDLVEQAYQLYSSGDIKEAISKLDQARLKAIEKKDIHNQARITGKKGVFLLEADQLDAARACLEEVLTLSEEIDSKEIKADALSNLGLVCTKSGDPGTGLLKQQEAMIIAREIDNQFLIMTHLGLLGHAYIQLANMEEAGRAYIEALQIAKDIGDISSQSGFLNNLGIIFGNLDQHENAVRAFSELSDLATESAEYTLALNAEMNLVKHAIAEGKIEEIIAHSRKGLDLIDSYLDTADQRKAFEEMLLLGLMSKGDYASAKHELTEIITKAEDDKDIPRLLKGIGQLADANYALGELQAAEKDYQRALELSVRLQDKLVEVRILGRLGALFADLDDLEKSNQYLMRSLAGSEGLEKNQLFAELHYLLALNFHEMDDIVQALEHARTAVEIYLASGAGSPGEKARILLDTLQSE